MRALSQLPILGWSIENPWHKRHLILDDHGRARAACGRRRHAGSVDAWRRVMDVYHCCRRCLKSAAHQREIDA